MMRSNYIDNIFHFSPQGDENIHVFKLPTRQKTLPELILEGLNKGKWK